MGGVPPAWAGLLHRYCVSRASAWINARPGARPDRACGYFPRPATFLAAVLRAVVALGLLLAVDLLAVLATAFLLADFAAFAGAAFLAVGLLLTFVAARVADGVDDFLPTAVFFAALPAVLRVAAFGDVAFLAAGFSTTAFFTGVLRFGAARVLAASGTAPIDSMVGSTGTTNGPVRSSALNASPLLAGVSISVGMPCSVDEGATPTRARLGARA
jgi:hypothetical protein